MDLYLDLPSYGNIHVLNPKNQKPNSVVLNTIKNSSSAFVLQTQNSLTISQSFWKKTPNVIRYTYKYLGNLQFQLASRRCSCYTITSSNYPDIDFAGSYLSERRLIGIILESPHKDEYNLHNTRISPIAPAQGATGRTINTEILDVIIKVARQINSLAIKFDLNEIIDIVILNPIPYQTSLAHIHQQALSNSSYTTLRNNVWKCIWNTPGIQNDFLTVLSKFSSKDILINCCTSELKKILDPWLQSQLHTPSPYLMTGHHPSARSSWKNSIT